VLGQVQGANSQLATKQLVSRNELSSMRQELLTKMFQLMQGAGVDPGDPSSIKQLLTELEQKDPTLLQLFQDAFRVISEQTNGGQNMAGGAEEMGAAEQGAPPDEGAMEQGAPTDQSGMSPLSSQFQNLQRMG